MSPAAPAPLAAPAAALPRADLERDAGVLSKLMVTPTPRSALVTGKAFAAGMRALSQAVVVIVLSLVLGVSLLLAPWRLLGAGPWPCSARRSSPPSP